MRSRNRLLAAAAAAALSLPASADASSIAIDWFGGSGANAQPQMTPDEVAGVVPQGNWNSFTGTAGGPEPLNLDNGTGSGATVSWGGSANLWDTNGAVDTPNRKMMQGYLDTGDQTVTTVNVAGLPASVTAPGYNVIVYYDGDNAGNSPQSRVGRYEVNGAPPQWGQDPAATRFDASDTFILGQTPLDPTIATDPPGDIDNEPAAVATVPPGNYMVFGPFTAADFTLTAQASVSSGGTNRAPLNGLQIIQIPEPASLGLLAFGGMGLLVRRRARRG